MPLPFAPPPKDSSLYQQLESTTLQTLTADQLATIRAKTFSQGTEGNEDEYRRILLLGLASDKLSVSGPIGYEYVEVNISGAEDTAKLWFQPNEGEIWQLGWGVWTGDGASNHLYQAQDSSGTIGSGSINQIFFSSATSGKMCTDASGEIAGGARIYVTYDHPLYVQTYSDTNGADWAGFFCRLRG
jgi:hypothetical protein